MTVLFLSRVAVVAAGYSASPYYVVPEENHVTTRMFFMYSGGTSAAVSASSLTLPDATTLKQEKAKVMAKRAGPAKS